MAKKPTLQKCSFCGMKFNDKSSLYDHIELKHKSLLPKDMSVSQYVFNMKYNKQFGKCVICGGKTKWNESVERYDRLCSEKCKEDYKKAFQKRMINKHGEVYLTRKPEHQRKMLANRKISGQYEWSDGSAKVGYTGSYELQFLKFLDVVMNFNSTDIISPAPQNFYYKDENGKERFYFPDFFIPSLNLIIEIKDGGDNPNKHHKIQEVDKKLEKLKDAEMLKQTKFNFVKVSNNDYSGFINYLIDLKQHDPEKCKAPLVRIKESSFDNIAKKLVGNKPLLEDCSNMNLQEQIRFYSDLAKMSLHKEEYQDKILNAIYESIIISLDDNLIIESEEKIDFNNYILKEEKMYALNNLEDFQRNIRTFKNCPPLKKKILAESLYEYAKKNNQTIPKISQIWSYITESDENHDDLKHGNNRPELEFKYDEIETYPKINEILDNAKNIYLGSDWHLYQSKRKNLFTKNPIPEINDILINNQILTVKSDDVFIFLGDMVDDEFINKEELIRNIAKLSGYKIWVLGNNDMFDESFYADCGFHHVVKAFRWNNYVFTHYPIPVEGNIINFHGHIHGSRSYMKMDDRNHIDVYTDLHGYKPLHIQTALVNYEKGFYRGLSYAPDYHFDRTFLKQRLKNENYSFDASIQKAKDHLKAQYNYENTQFESFVLMGKKRKAVITNVKGSSDNNGGWYAVNYGRLLIDDQEASSEVETLPIYILGIRSQEVEEGDTVQVRIIGCIERPDDSEYLIGQYIHNKRDYTPLQIASLIYPQERHYEGDLYLYDKESRVTRLVDIENDVMDIDSEEFMAKLVESFTLDVEGNLLLNMKEKSDFMARYMTSHRLMKIYEQTGSVENIKYELCKLYYMLEVIESYYVRNDKGNVLARYMHSRHRNEALKAKAFIANDFNKYLKYVLEHEPEFNFSVYFSKTDYYKDVIAFTPEKIRGLKKLVSSVIV